MPKFRFLDEILSVNLLKLNLLVQDLDQGTGAGENQVHYDFGTGITSFSSIWNGLL